MFGNHKGRHISNISPFSFTVKKPKENSGVEASPTPAPAPEKKILWGEPTWFLFHTLAEKMKEDSFPKIKGDFLNMCSTICRNLPCPSCRDHATEYMQKINFSAIQNKQQLKDLFFEFHNTINRRKGVDIFPRADLDEKYNQAITQNIIQNFLNHFRDKSHSIRMIADDFFRQRAYITIVDWLRANLQHFQP
jgi:hypothetical protein